MLLPSRATYTVGASGGTVAEHVVPSRTNPEAHWQPPLASQSPLPPQVSDELQNTSQNCPNHEASQAHTPPSSQMPLPLQLQAAVVPTPGSVASGPAVVCPNPSGSVVATSGSVASGPAVVSTPGKVISRFAVVATPGSVPSGPAVVPTPG
eukprot:1766346-Rhodomonas_salina.1